MRALLQRLRYLLRPPHVSLVYHPAYATTMAGVPVDPARADRTLAFLLDESLIRRRDVSRPIPGSLENILRVHTPRYLESLQEAAALEQILGGPVREDDVAAIIDHFRLVVGGTIQATRLALAGRRVAVHLAGGLHHAAPDRGMGFCVFNDIAVAVRRLQARGFQCRVLVVDLDVHDGNGTRACFANDATVHTFSIHNATWDEAPAVSATVIALGSGVTDEQLLATLRDALPPVVARHKPDLVIYVAGCDMAGDDRMGDWKLSPGGMLARDRFVIETVRRGDAPPPVVVLPGGGYGTGAWRYTARFASWLASDHVVEPPDDMELILRRFRPIARSIAPAADGDDWGLTEEDLGGLGAAGAHETRVLGHYTRHGLELLLERLGFFDRLRALGFRHPVLTVDFGSGVGQTIRLYGDAARTELVMELRLSRNRRAVPGMDLAFIEWLLLQNPRRQFDAHQPRLPGQEHPGLGLLGEVAAWLVVACETIPLDGIGFVPAHYYTAVLGRHYLRFVQPQAQARFDGLRDALRGLPLDAASRAIDEGRVLDGSGATVEWPAEAMVMPVSERLRALVTGAAYDAAVARARSGLSYGVKTSTTLV
jgi:acetoin utilization deacetylase AcuC-like enzyme